MPPSDRAGGIPSFPAVGFIRYLEKGDAQMIFVILIAVFIGAAFLFGLQKKSVTAPGRELHQLFVELGQLPGKPKDEIIAKVGPPTSISAIGNGRQLLQWQATGCHVALVFNGESCEGIAHQYLHQG